MTIHFYFEFITGHQGGLALKLNGEVIGLQMVSIFEKKMFHHELKNYDEPLISISLVALGGQSQYIVHMVNDHSGGRFTQVWELEDNRKEVVKSIDLTILGTNTNTLSEHQIRPQNRAVDKPAYKKTKKKVYRSTISFNQEKKPDPDYIYYENQTPREQLLTPRAEQPQNTWVEVFYATDRKVKQKKKGRITYTNTRGDLQLGSCLVSVPANKKKGEIPLPPWYLFGFFSDEDDYMQIKEIDQLPATEFFKKITDKVQGSPEKDAFVFVHGFNVDFTQSVMRAAQIATDIGFHGAPIVYSWPSRHNVLRYNADEATATGYSADNVIQLLKDIRTTTGAERVHLIAHSMGNRILTDALKSLVDKGFNKNFLFNQIILAAPDIDAEVFVKNIAPKIIGCSQRVTLYTSQHDKPLWFSDKIHGSIQRTGSSANALAIIDGMDTVDASIERTDFLGHGYFADSRALIDDIFQAIRYNRGPEDRNLRRRTAGDKFYWEFY